MAECSDRDCREELLKGIDDKVPRTWIWKFVVVLGVVVISWGGTTWYKATNANERLDRLEDVVSKNAEVVNDLTKLVVQNQITSVTCQTRLGSIDDTLRDIKRMVQQRHDNENERPVPRNP
jgi:uncharacterized coiled-coil protein SlyX